MKCLSTETTTGTPCMRTVGRDGCPHHGNHHIQERLRQANRPKLAKPEQLPLLRLTRDEISILIRHGYMAEQALRTNADEICGCQG